ncbi:hypothetical protein PG984_007010 [Apiospora sp. TS-2023a]
MMLQWVLGREYQRKLARKSVATDITENRQVFKGNVHVPGNNNKIGMFMSNEDEADTRTWMTQQSAGIVRPSPPHHVSPLLSRRVFRSPKFQACLNNKGHTLVLLGKPGVGKTTTMLHLQRLLSTKIGPLEPISEPIAEPITQTQNSVDVCDGGFKDGGHDWATSILLAVAYCTILALRSINCLFQPWTLTFLNLLVGTLEGDCAIADAAHQNTRPIVTASIFFRYEDRYSDGNKTGGRSPHDAARIMMEILRQLVDQTDGSLQIATELREELKGNSPQPRDISNAVIDVLRKSPSACIFVDAMDECMPDQRETIIQELQHVQHEAQVGIITSDRVGSSNWTYHYSPESPLAARNRDVMELQSLKDDIYDVLGSILDKRFDEDNEQYDWVKEESVKDSTIRKITEVSDENFLLAKLNLEFLSGSRCCDDLANNLKSLVGMSYRADQADDEYFKVVLAPAYERNLKRVLTTQPRDMRDAVDAKLALSFIRDSYRILLDTELLALVKEGQIGFSVEWRRIERCCRGLIVRDNTSRTVGFLHRSFRQYLGSRSGLELIGCSHERLGKACLSYLQRFNFDSAVDPESSAPKERPRAWPLLNYAARYWGHHLQQFETLERESGHDIGNRHYSEGKIHAQALSFLQDNRRVNAAYRVRMLSDNKVHRVRGGKDWKSAKMLRSVPVMLLPSQSRLNRFATSVISGLHVACKDNLRGLAKQLIINSTSSTSSINQKDVFSLTPLHYAAIYDDPETANILIDAGANPNIKTESGMTLLMIAGYKVTKVLIERSDIDINEANVRLGPWKNWYLKDYLEGATQFSPTGSAFSDFLFRSPPKLYEFEQIHIGSGPRTTYYRMYPVEDCRVEKPKTHLQTAARIGSWQRLKLFLEHPNIDIEVTDDKGMTAPHHAAMGGSVRCVKALQEAGADLVRRIRASTSAFPLVSGNVHNWDQATALHVAVYYGRSEALVSYLIQQFAAGMCNDTDIRGWTPLHYAAKGNGSASIVSLLLRQTNIEFNPRANDGSTPLHEVTNPEALKTLIAQDGVDVMARDPKGRTPLHRLAERSDDKLLKLMLGHEAVDLNAPDIYGRSPIFYAAASGHRKAFSALWGHKYLNRDLRDNEGQPFQEYARGRIHRTVRSPVADL